MDKETDAQRIRKEYDFSNGVRGKHYLAYRGGHAVNVRKPDGTFEVRYFSQEEGSVMLDPDGRKHFRSAASVNRALRAPVAAH